MRSSLRSVPGVIFLLFAAGQADPAGAAGNRNAKIMLQALSPVMKNGCVRPATVPATCSGYVVNNLGLYPTRHFVYALVTNGTQVEGVSGAAFGIDYDPALQSGVDVFSWTLCATLEFPSAGWPAAGGGNLITFDAVTRCQTSGNANVGVVAVLGYFYCAAYTPDVMRVTRRPVYDDASVTNCGLEVDETPSGNEGPWCNFLGQLGFGPGRTGHNPCGLEIIDVACGSPVSCAITGPDDVTSGQTGIPFQYTGGVGDPRWTITGNGTFDGPTYNQHTVYVTAGSPGQFTVTLHTQAGHGSADCERTITVEDAVPAVPTSWGRIKALVRD
ncbi:MAG TPA: hypothetical protein VF720_13815 [Candidatus Eisenbacteria bacterium]